MKLNHAAKIFLVVGLSVGAQKATADNQSSVSALPDANVAAVSDSGYVDPEISNRNRCLNQRWSRIFGPVVKVDRMTKEVIPNDKTKEPFARFQSQGCA
ncbi:hypothetical protein [Yoonia sp. MH D7]